VDYSLLSRRTRRLLDGRSVVVAMLVLLVGAGLGFAGGDVYGHDTAHTTPQTTRAAQPNTWNPTSPQGRQQLLSCLVGKNVPYLDPSTADFKTPPPGVDDATLNAALGVCYRQLAAKGGR
jgi:hypothetical protein